MLIDTHCHLHDKEFFSAEQAETCLDRAHEAGVEKVICIGTSHEDSIAASEFASRHKDVYWTYGIHPENSIRQLEYDFLQAGLPAPVFTDSKSLDSAAVSICSQKAHSQLPIAIGEVGLDYHYSGYDREAQIRLFEGMLQLAVDNDLPVSFHVREAFPDFFAVMSNFSKVRGVVHSFTDSKKVLKRILNETEFYV
ncbi:TatD family hydrolase, partial [Candidatus Saccharibacteria bacterium]|nr:TatD family hydrolase [Candidatus Saccharibacteria bacterium]